MITSAAKIAELRDLLGGEDAAEWVSNLWSKYKMNRSVKDEEILELHKYLFATDTTTTSNSKLPWTHTSTLPKLTQIRDNLEANYLSSLFPNDKWMTWVAYTKESAKKEVAKTLLGYMENKTREGGLRKVVSNLLLDYIDTGNAFAQPTFETRYKNIPGKEKLVSFVGPKAVRIDPNDIVFNPLAAEFSKTWKIVRSNISLGSIKRLMKDDPDQTGIWTDYLQHRVKMYKASTGYSSEDFNAATSFTDEGFGNIQEYYTSQRVEVLEFYGDYHDPKTGIVHEGQWITVADRNKVISIRDIQTYSGEDDIRQVGWRKRPGNLWAMGPLDNLVGLQYMIDHYLNMGSNALDLKVMSPKKVRGDIEEFVWEPNAIIDVGDDGDIEEMAQQYGDMVTIAEWINMAEEHMELFAGAPREAMGVRTPGEKTAFEVQTLDNAASRFYHEKIVQFELFLEEVLNDMLEVAHRNMHQSDTIRVIDDDNQAAQFVNVDKSTLTADGIIRPVGARHFAQKAQELQNLTGVFNTPLGNLILPHTSAIEMTNFISDAMDLRGYKLFTPNIAVSEQQETQSLAGQAMEDNEVASSISEEEVAFEQETANEGEADNGSLPV